MKKVYFITGSQDLYGEEVLLQVAEDSKVIAKYLNEKIDGVEIEYVSTVRDEASCVEACKKASKYRHTPCFYCRGRNGCKCKGQR